MKGRIAIVEGNIAEQDVDAVVNAANSALILGSGVAGAIRALGGPSIQQECNAIGAIEVGAAAITGGGNLPARYVIHAASMPPGGNATEETVEKSMRSALEVASAHDLRSLAVPALGAGVGGVSIERSAKILISVARKVQAGPKPFDEIRFVLFGEPSYRVFEMVNDAVKVAAQMQRFKSS